MSGVFEFVLVIGVVIALAYYLLILRNVSLGSRLWNEITMTVAPFLLITAINLAFVLSIPFTIGTCVGFLWLMGLFKVLVVMGIKDSDHSKVIKALIREHGLDGLRDEMGKTGTEIQNGNG